MSLQEGMVVATSSGPITSIAQVIENTNQDTADVLYISDGVKTTEKSKIKRYYREDFVLVRQNEVKKICDDDKKLQLPKNHNNHDFFVYNERKHQIIPFKKNDYLMDKDGYLTFDGTSYFYYDNDGNELWNF